MGIGAESLIFSSADAVQVVDGLTSYLSDMGFEPRFADPVKSAAAFYPFHKKRRRFFYVDQYRSGLTCVAEIGDFADRDLAKALSLDVGGVFWLALHEAENAWGLQFYCDGESLRGEMHPRSAFLSGVEAEDYEKDATEEAFDAAMDIGDFEPFCSYNQRANGYEPEGIEKTLHVAFLRVGD